MINLFPKRMSRTAKLKQNKIIGENMVIEQNNTKVNTDHIDIRNNIQSIKIVKQNCLSNIKNFEFRPICKELMTDIKRFHTDLFGENKYLFGDRFFSKLLNEKLFHTLILFDKQQKTNVIAGICCFQTSGYIYSFGIRYVYRCQGLGKYLLQCAITYMIDMRYYEASLNVNTRNNAAVKLYSKCGFKIIQKIDNFYLNDPYGSDAYDMALKLPIQKNDITCLNAIDLKSWNCIHRINGLLTCIEPFC
eukprot:437591_1